MQRKQVVGCLVGAKGVGKTSLLLAYFNKHFQQDQKPTIFPDFSSTTLMYKDEEITYKIWDTAENDEAFNKEPVTDVYFACIDLEDRRTLDYIDGALTTIKQRSPEALIMLVATKTDLPQENTVAHEDIQNLTAKHQITCVTQACAKNFDDGQVAALFKSAFNLAVRRKFQAVQPVEVVKDAASQSGQASTVFKLFDQARQGWPAQQPEAKDAHLVLRLRGPAK